MWSPIDDLGWPDFWVYIGLMAFPVGIAVWRAWRTGTRDAERWVAACGMEPIGELLPSALRYVRWSRWWRSAGFILGWLVALSGPIVTGDARTDWFPGGLRWLVVLAGYLLGVMVGELLRPRPRRGGAELIWRRATDVVPRWASWLTVVSLAVGLLVIWLGEPGDINHAAIYLQPPLGRIIWTSASLAVVLGWVGIVAILRRPLRGADEVELRLEESRRATSIRAVAGAVTAIAFLSADTLVAGLPLLSYPVDSTWRDLLFGVGLSVVGPALGYGIFSAIADLGAPHPLSTNSRLDMETS